MDIVPGILGATPLKCEDHADDGRDQGQGTGKIEFFQLLPPGGVLKGRFVPWDQEQDQDACYASEGEVDVEAPSPGQVLGEGAAHTVYRVSFAKP